MTHRVRHGRSRFVRQNERTRRTGSSSYSSADRVLDLGDGAEVAEELLLDPSHDVKTAQVENLENQIALTEIARPVQDLLDKVRNRAFLTGLNQLGRR